MRSRRLLIIDDIPVFSAYVRDVAEGLDFSVRVAAHAGHFRSLHHAFLPHVVCLDIVMPDGDGLQILNWLCEQGSDAHVLIVSGYGADYAEAAVQVAEAKGHDRVAALHKPVGLNQLRSALMARAA